MMRAAGHIVLAVAALMLAGYARADVPVAASNAAASSAVLPAQPVVFEIIPEDPLAAKLKFSGKTKTYKKTFYLRGYSLSGSYWMDDHRYLTEIHASDGFEAKYGEIQPKIVVVDVLTGKVEETGLLGDIRCYNEGRIAMGTRNVSNNWIMYFGKLGESLKIYPGGFPRDLELNVESCQLVSAWKYPKDEMGGDLRLLRRFPLKVEHGAIFERQPDSYPALKIGQDEHGRLGFYRDGPAEMPPLHVYWEQPSGKRIDIPFNPGEKISNVLYLPYEKAYLIRVDLSGTQPIEGTAPRFERLLYLDGTVKRFGVPSVIMDLVRARKAIGMAAYSKNGIEWGVGFNSREPDKQNIGGFHEVTGDVLVKIEPLVGFPGPDGCREYGEETQPFSKRHNFFYIDVCKGE